MMDEFKEEVRAENEKKKLVGSKIGGDIKNGNVPSLQLEGSHDKNQNRDTFTDTQVAKRAGVGTGTVARYNKVMNSNDEELKKEKYNMDRELIIKNIMVNYGERGITEDMVNEVIDAGLESGANYDLIYLDIMGRISEIVREEFLCTPEDMARAYNVPIEVIREMIEEGKEELIAAGENPDEYFKEVPVNRFFI